MPTPQLVLNQTGLSSGVINQARSDGLRTGAQVTVSSAGPGDLHVFELLWAPEDDTTAATSFTQNTSTTATFSPDPACAGGSYRIKLTVTGTTGADEIIRIFAIRTTEGLRIPALNERANDLATLDNGATYVRDSEFNEPAAGPFATGDYGGWYKSIADLIRFVNDGGGGGGGLQVVGTPEFYDVVSWDANEGRWEPMKRTGWENSQNGTYPGLFVVSDYLDSVYDHTFIETGNSGSFVVTYGGRDNGKSAYTIPNPTTGEYQGRRMRWSDSGGQAQATPIRVICETGTAGHIAMNMGDGSGYNTVRFVDMDQPYGTLELEWMPHTDPTKRKWLVTSITRAAGSSGEGGGGLPTNGDVVDGGNGTNLTVKLQGKALYASNPNYADIMAYVGNAWTPQSLATLLQAAGIGYKMPGLTTEYVLNAGDTNGSYLYTSPQLDDCACLALASSGAAPVVHGLDSPQDKNNPYHLTVINTSAESITFVHETSEGGDGSRKFNSHTGADVVLGPYGKMDIIWVPDGQLNIGDGSSVDDNSRWRIY